MFDSLLITGLFTVFFILPLLLLLLLLLFDGLGFEEEVFKSIEVLLLLLLLLLLFVESTGFSFSFILGTRNGS